MIHGDEWDAPSFLVDERRAQHGRHAEASWRELAIWLNISRELKQ